MVEWESGSTAALEHLRTVFADATFWKTLIRHLAQEHTRDYMAADNTALVKSIFQILGAGPLAVVLPLVDELLLSDLREIDRHHQRAAAEVIGGMFRGSKHWPLDDQRRLWDWLEPSSSASSTPSRRTRKSPGRCWSVGRCSDQN